MSRYINPYTDFGFKKLFSEEANVDLLIDFLNTFLPEKHRIKTLTFRNAEQLGSSASDRKAIFDIYCEAESGEKFIVEMQNAKQHYFKDRAPFRFGIRAFVATSGNSSFRRFTSSAFSVSSTTSRKNAGNFGGMSCSRIRTATCFMTNCV